MKNIALLIKKFILKNNHANCDIGYSYSELHVQDIYIDGVAKAIARHLIASGIGDITAENAKWDILCNKFGEIIANDKDCENGCYSEALRIINEVKQYSGEYDKLKHLADMAEYTPIVCTKAEIYDTYVIGGFDLAETTENERLTNDSKAYEQAKTEPIKILEV